MRSRLFALYETAPLHGNSRKMKNILLCRLTMPATRNFETIIWKPWAPPKCKFFSSLAIPNRIWTADRLEARNWSNQRICPLCRIPTKHLWSEITVWTATPNLHPNAWPPSDTLENWWMAISAAPSASRSVTPLVLRTCLAQRFRSEKD